MEVVASLSQGRTAAAHCGLFTYKSVPVIFEPPCNSLQIVLSIGFMIYNAVVLVTATVARGLMSSLSNKLKTKLMWCSRAQKTLRHIIQTLQNPMKK